MVIHPSLYIYIWLYVFLYIYIYIYIWFYIYIYVNPFFVDRWPSPRWVYHPSIDKAAHTSTAYFKFRHSHTVSRLVVCFILLKGKCAFRRKVWTSPVVKTCQNGFHKGWVFYPFGLSITDHPGGNSFNMFQQSHRNSRQHISTRVRPSSSFPNTHVSSKVTWCQTHPPQIGIQSLNLWKCCCYWCCSRSPHHCCDLTANIALAHNSTALANYKAK